MIGVQWAIGRIALLGRLLVALTVISAGVSVSGMVYLQAYAAMHARQIMKVGSLSSGDDRQTVVAKLGQPVEVIVGTRLTRAGRPVVCDITREVMVFSLFDAYAFVGFDNRGLITEAWFQVVPGLQLGGPVAGQDPAKDLPKTRTRHYLRGPIGLFELLVVSLVRLLFRSVELISGRLVGLSLSSAITSLAVGRYLLRTQRQYRTVIRWAIPATYAASASVCYFTAILLHPPLLVGYGLIYLAVIALVGPLTVACCLPRLHLGKYLGEQEGQ